MRRIVRILVLATSTLFMPFVIIAECTEEARVLLSIWLVGGSALCYWAWVQTQRNITASVSLGTLIWYYYFAFVLKAAVAPAPDIAIIRYWFGERFLGNSLDYSVALALCMSVVTAALLAIALVSRLPQLIPPNLPGRFRTHLVLLSIIILVLLVVKYVVHYLYGWGVPGHEASMSIPVVTGVVVFASRVGLFYLISAYLYLSIVRDRSMIHALISALSALAYILLDLGIGSKYSLVYLSVVLVFIILEYRRIYGALQRVVVVLTAAGLLAGALIYRYINYYRSARLRAEGMSVNEMIAFARDYATQDTSSFAEFYNRVSGFDNFQGAISWSGMLRPQWYDLISSTSLTDSYTALMTGITGSVNAMGSTQPAMIALLAGGNIAMAFLLGCALTSAVVSTATLLSFGSLRHHESRRVMAITLAIFLVYMQFGAGNFLFFGKELLVMLIASFFVDRFVFYRVPG